MTDYDPDQMAHSEAIFMLRKGLKHGEVPEKYEPAIERCREAFGETLMEALNDIPPEKRAGKYRPTHSDADPSGVSEGHPVHLTDDELADRLDGHAGRKDAEYLAFKEAARRLRRTEDDGRGEGWSERARNLLGKLLEDIQGGRTDSVVDCPCSRVAGRTDEIADLLSQAPTHSDADPSGIADRLDEALDGRDWPGAELDPIHKAAADARDYLRRATPDPSEGEVRCDHENTVLDDNVEWCPDCRRVMPEDPEDAEDDGRGEGCTCPRLADGSHGWDPICPRHGTDRSEWCAYEDHVPGRQDYGFTGRGGRKRLCRKCDAPLEIHEDDGGKYTEGWHGEKTDRSPTHSDADPELGHDVEDVREQSDEELVDALESLARNFCLEAGFGYAPVNLAGLEIKRRLQSRSDADPSGEVDDG